jgi:hypothetical protein
MQSDAIRGNDLYAREFRRLVAIRGNQRQSDAIKGNHLYAREFRRLVTKALRLLVALSVRKLEEYDDGRCGKVARGQVVRPRCMQPEAIRGNQRQSEAIRGHHLAGSPTMLHATAPRHPP